VGCALAYLDLRCEELAWRQQYPQLQRLEEKLRTRPSFTTTAPPRK